MRGLASYSGLQWLPLSLDWDSGVLAIVGSSTAPVTSVGSDCATSLDHAFTIKAIDIDSSRYVQYNSALLETSDLYIRLASA